MLLPLAALAWILAIASVGLWHLPWWLPPLWFVFLSPAIAVRWGGRATALILVLAFVALVGGHRYHEWKTRPPLDLLSSTGHPVTITGTVDSDLTRSSTNVSYLIDVHSITDRGKTRPTGGRVQVNLDQYDHLVRGATVTFDGSISRPFNFGDFDYREYLLRRDVAGIMHSPTLVSAEAPWRWNPSRLISAGRVRLGNSLDQALPEPEASLARGILIGDDSGMPSDLKENFRKSGLSHIVAVSGSNISILTMLALAMLVPLVGRNHARWAMFVIILIYVPLTGAQPSVLRAAVMATCMLTANWFGRQNSAMPALALAVVAMTAWNPAVIEDVGFQLSVTATAGIVVLSPWITYGLAWAARSLQLDSVIPRVLIEMASLSFAASLATLPITYEAFGRVSLVGPFVNVVVDPLFTFAFAASLVVGVAGLFSETLALAAGLLAYYPVAIITWLARESGSLPGAAVDAPSISRDWIVFALVAISAAAIPAYIAAVPDIRPAGGYSERVRPVVRVATVGFVCALLLVVDIVPWRRTDDGLKVSVFDMDHGDAILLTTPSGNRVLIDGGGSGPDAIRQLDAVIPHWSRSIDRWILTSDADSQTGASPLVSARYDVPSAFGQLTPRGISDGAKTPLRVAGPANFTLDGVAIELIPVGYAGTKPNPEHMVQAVRITYGDQHLLIALSLDAQLQSALTDGGDTGDRILITGAASQTVLKSAVLAGIHPELVIVTSKGSRANSADATNAANARILRTNTAGTVTLHLSGTKLGIDTER